MSLIAEDKQGFSPRLAPARAHRTAAVVAE